MESGRMESGRMSNSANPESARMDSGRKESGRISDSVNPESARMESGRTESGRMSTQVKIKSGETTRYHNFPGLSFVLQGSDWIHFEMQNKRNDMCELYICSFKYPHQCLQI
jgi:hypothetical protein